MNAPLSALQKARALSVEFAARAAEHDRDASFPFENFAQLHEAGLLGLAVPREFGGGQATLSELGEVIGAIGEGDPAIALVLTMQYLQHRGLARKGHWPRDLVARIAREAITEGALINALRVEPEQGSPARGGLPATVARRTAEGWRISGRKTYSTGSPILRWYAVWARTDESFAPEPQLGVFLVPAGLPGSRIVETWDHLGLRASGSHDVVFEDVLVPLDHAAELRPPQAWATPDLDQQAEMVVMLAALYDGVARSARAWLLDFLRSRSPGSLGAPLATLPRMQEQVGVIEGLLLTNQQLIRGLAQATDAGQLPPASDAGLVKQIVTSNAIKAVELSVALSSNHGLSRKNPLERHLRDVLCGRVHTPQDDSVHIAAGRRALGV